MRIVWMRIFTLLALLLSATLAQAGQDRLALVIGNGSYADAPLRNPVNDARDMADTLKVLGFEVTVETDLDRRGLRRAIRRFGKRLKDYEVGLFYFAGHGIQVDGSNYLVPVGADVGTEDEVIDEGVDANSVLRKMKAAGNLLNIVILDSCRNNPFARSFRSSHRGLARMEGPTGSLIAYSTAPGKVAADGDGRNGIYTQHLMKQMRKPGLTIHQVMARTRVAVERATDGQQIPWESSSLRGDFYFSGDPGKQSQVAAMPQARPVGSGPSTAIMELELWRSSDRCGTVDCLRAYLDKYPQGQFASVAQARLKSLERPALEAPPKPEKLTLTVKTTPADARVRILNIRPKYRDGIELKAGRYHLEGSKAGYKRKTLWHNLDADSQVVYLELEKQVKRDQVAFAAADSQARAQPRKRTTITPAPVTGAVNEILSKIRPGARALRIAYVDVTRVSEESPQYREARAMLQRELEEKEADLRRMAERVKSGYISEARLARKRDEYREDMSRRQNEERTKRERSCCRK